MYTIRIDFLGYTPTFIEFNSCDGFFTGYRWGEYHDKRPSTNYLTLYIANFADTDFQIIPPIDIHVTLCNFINMGKRLEFLIPLDIIKSINQEIPKYGLTREWKTLWESETKNDK